MNRRIAALLKDRISQFTYVDKLAGLVRAITYERNGEKITVPVSDQVDDLLACDETAMRELVPDERYQAIVYFEDRGLQAIRSRTRGLSYRSNLRLVCWINTAKFGSDAEAGSKVMQQFIGAIDGPPYAFGPFLGVRHQIDAIPQRGPGIFSAYSYLDSKRQFLLYPFDAFAIDIITDLRVIPGCEDEVTVGNDECWAPSTLRRRRYPREFSCDELNDASTGLTDEQKEECLDCSGDGDDCPRECEVIEGMDASEIVACVPSADRPALLCEVMDTAEATPEAIVVCLDGANKTDAVKAIICNPCPECNPLELTVNGVAFEEVEDPCGATTNVRVLDADDNPVGSLDAPDWRIPSATVQLKDSANNDIGSADSYLPGANTTKTAPDGDVALNGAPVGSVKSNGSIDIPIVNTDDTPVGAWDEGDEEFVIGDAKVQVNGVDVLTEIVAESQSNEVEVVDTDEVAVGSLVSGQWQIADSVLTKPDSTTMNLLAEQPFDIRTLRSGIVYQFGMILHYGNSTSYRTGDEGDMLANGFFDYTRPVYPTNYAELVNNTTLVSNNVHGNTNRFTDRSGGQTYSDGIVQDHFQGVEIYRVLQSAATWNNAIDGAVALSIGGDTDWRVTPMRVLLTVMNGAAGAGANFLNFAPFSINNTNYWTSTTQAFSTANAFRVAAGQPVTTAKTNTNAWLACRRFI